MLQTDSEMAVPEVTPDAVRDLYGDLLDADRDGASSNDWTQIIDGWFVAQGFPTILFRAEK